MKKNVISVIEITDLYIKLLQAKHLQKKSCLYSYSMELIKNFSDEEIAKVLSRMIKQLKMPLGKVVTIIPRRYKTVIPLQLPTQAPEELSRMIGLQVVSYVPFSKDDIVYDYSVIHRNLSGYTKVLTVVANRENIQRYLDVFQKARIRVENLTISSVGLFHWYKYFYATSNKKESDDVDIQILSKVSPQNVPLSSTQQPVELIVNIDDSNTELCFCQGNSLLFSREIYFGLQDISGDGLKGFLRQLGLTITAYQRENMGEPIQNIILIFPKKQNKELVDFIKKESSIPIKPIVLDIDHFFPQANVNNLPRDTIGINWSSLLGLSFGEQPTLNFISKEVSTGLILGKHCRERVWLIILVCIVMALLVVLKQLKFYQSQGDLNFISRQVKNNQAKLKEAKSKVQEWKFVQNELKQYQSVMPLLDQLNQLVPADVVIVALDYDIKGSVKIEAVTKLENGDMQLKDALLASPLFKDVILVSSESQRQSNTGLIYVKLTCQITNSDLANTP